MNNLSNRLDRLERRTPAKSGLTHVLRTIVSGGHGAPIIEELNIVTVIGGGRFARMDGEAVADFCARAGIEQ